MFNKNKKTVSVLVTTLVVGVAGVTAFQEPTAGPWAGGFAGYLQHLFSGDKSFNTTTPSSPSVWEIGLDVSTGDVNSSQIVQNPDGDLLERVEFIQENMNNLDEAEVDTMVANNGYLTAESQDLNAVLTEGNDAGGSVIANVGTPVASADVATKSYVDSVDAASSGGFSPYCYYTNAASCPANFSLMSGTYSPYSGGTHYTCCSKDVAAIQEKCAGYVSGAVCAVDGEGDSVFAGTLNGVNYMTTPGGCTDSTTPTCAWGADSVQKTWGTYGTVTYADSVDNGIYNTATLANNYSDTYAAKYCADMVYGGYDDWFLPAKDQLDMLYGFKNYIGGFSSTYYWSSTEHNSSLARSQAFTAGAQDDANKTNSYAVRCLRSF